MTPPPADFILRDDSIDTVEIAFGRSREEGGRVVLGRAFDRTNVRTAGIIYKDCEPDPAAKLLSNVDSIETLSPHRFICEAFRQPWQSPPQPFLLVSD